MCSHKLSTRFYLLVCLILWLIPFFWAGWKNQAWRWLPRAFTFQHSAAGLFTRQTTRWWDHGVEIQKADGSWVEAEENRLFPMGAFGFRTRYDRILNESNSAGQKEGIRRHLAEHVMNLMQAEKWPEAEGLKGLRLIRTMWPVGCAETAQPAGEWSIPTLGSLPASRRETLAEYQWVKGRLVTAPPPKKKPGPLKLPALPPKRVLVPPMPMLPRGLPEAPDQTDSEAPNRDEVSEGQNDG